MFKIKENLVAKFTQFVNGSKAQLATCTVVGYCNSCGNNCIGTCSGSCRGDCSGSCHRYSR